MRAFLFASSSAAGLLSDRRTRPALALHLLVLLIFIANPPSAWAQYPGELTGRVLDALTHSPVEGALVEVTGTTLSVITDGRGEFRIRGIEPGSRTVRVSRLGYATTTQEITIANGERLELTVSLAVRPVDLDAVRADARRRDAVGPGVIVIPRAEIAASDARDAADLLEGRAGLIVTRSGPGGPKHVSIRGGAADQVLVLLDGVPLADPLTGAADLSSVPVSQIESVTVLKGSQSARYGPGAEVGAILIQTRATAAPLAARLATGSLGERGGHGETAGDWLGLRWSAGAGIRDMDGGFDYERPSALGGGIARRLNSDLEEVSAFLAASGRAAGGELRARGGFTDLERGLPGPSFLPTTAARQDLTRWSGQTAWDRVDGAWRFSAQLHALDQTARYVDPAPPAGLPYDSRTRARVLGARAAGELDVQSALRHLSFGLEARDQRYESDGLAPGAPDGRFDWGMFGTAELSLWEAGPGLTGALRLDRDGLAEHWRLTHELTVAAEAGPAAFHVRHASSFSPPSFGDQFFHEGVAVAANPDLRAERIPNEWNVGASVGGCLGSMARGRLSLEGYVADVRDMIIWAPDFRFVWSPRNFDVQRRGLEAGASLEIPRHRLELRGSYSLTRATYDRPGDADTIQIIYRPRHSAGASLTWRPPRWDLRLSARYVGTRYPVPARLNALSPFLTLDLQVRREFSAGGWTLTPSIAVDRLLDNEDSLIFGYPEPGRTLRFEMAAARR